ncbi:MAG: DUF2027 domain-containing protein [Bacteroidetes bacterium]|nr:DUF2027 domain-containing protein [Bacteroidota bacterium]MBK9412971.1 DUF2027 domain-containing protein [Bacteroidota bacterium]
MKLNIGDKVRFLNESIEGTIASVLSHGRVEVRDSHGFTHVSEERYLVRIELTLEEVQNDLNESSSVPKSSSPPPVQKSSIPIISSLDDDNTIYAAIRLLDEKNPLTTDVEIFLLNNTDYSICFTCLKRLGNFRAGIHSGVLNSNHESLIGVFSQDEIYRFDGFEFQFLFFKKEEFKPKNPDTKLLQFNSSDFMNADLRKKFYDRDDTILLLPLHEVKQMTEVDIVGLLDKYKDKKEAEARNLNAKTKNKSSRFVVLTRQKVVDLHIEELIKDYSSMSNAQIISYQINFFMQEMDKALIDKLHKIVFIHGVGAGVLRSSIREELKRFPNIRYTDAPIEKYGNGATEVEFI